jgi:nucleolar protein 12
MVEVEVENGEEPDESMLSAVQIRERKKRTCFVGNLPLDFTAKQMKKLFREFGKIQKIWFRSVPTV